MTTVLIVEDEPLIRDLIASVLSEEGYEVVVAESGRAALDLLATREAHLVLMDVMMPDGNGPETFRALQEDARLSAVPVIMMSAGVSRQALDPRVAGFLPKPFDLNRLLDLVARTLETSGAG
jgi:CheY-like chemotaxis protein